MKETNIAVLGSSGGVARAVLAIFNRAAADPADPLYPFLQRARLHLIDPVSRPGAYYQRFQNLSGRLNLMDPPSGEMGDLAAQLAATGTELVLDCSTGGCWEPLDACNRLGLGYVNTAIEYPPIGNSPQFAPFSNAARYHWLEARRPHLTSVRAIVCSGMNPGIVQWMALDLLGGEPPQALFIVEDDTTFLRDQAQADPETVYLSWSPAGFLEEAALNCAMHVRHHAPVFDLEHRSLATAYRVRLGSHEFDGCLVPHEEVLSLGRHFDCEIGFLYAVNRPTVSLLRRHLDAPERVLNLPRVLLDPGRSALSGEDLIGVVAVYPDREEYICNPLATAAVYPAYGVSATYFQTACGVYAATCALLLDPIPAGVHYVDDLLLHTNSRYGRYVRQHLRPFVRGVNPTSLGGLEQRRRF